MAHELLELMHPISQRREGSIHEFEIKSLDSSFMRGISSPTLILYARGDVLVKCTHAEFAHRTIKHSNLVHFETGDHGLLPQMDEFRKHVNLFLSEQVPRLQ